MKVTRALSLIAAVCVLSSCTGYLHGKPVLTGEEIDVLNAGIAQTQFSDIPVPVGFELQQRNVESFGTQVGSFRIGHLIYHGEVAPAEAAGYLATRLPEHGWKEASREDSPTGTIRMTFRKGPQTAELSIAREEGESGYRQQSKTNSTFFTKLLIDIKTQKGS